MPEESGNGRTTSRGEFAAAENGAIGDFPSEPDS